MEGRADGMPSSPQSMVVCDGDMLKLPYIESVSGIASLILSGELAWQLKSRGSCTLRFNTYSSLKWGFGNDAETKEENVD